MQGESCQGSRAVPLSSLTFTVWSQWKWSVISLDQVLYLTEGFWVELLPSHVVEGLIWAREGQEGEDKLTCLVETHRLRVHPAPVFCFVQEMNDSSAGNQNYSLDPLCCKKNMWDFRGREDEFSLSFYLPLPSLKQTGDSHRAGLPGASRDWGPSLTEGSPVCITSPRNQAQGFLCKENCCKIPMPLDSSPHSHPSTPLCHWRVLAGQRQRLLLIAKVSTAWAESRLHQGIQNSLVQLRCPWILCISQSGWQSLLKYFPEEKAFKSLMAAPRIENIWEPMGEPSWNVDAAHRTLKQNWRRLGEQSSKNLHFTPCSCKEWLA